MSDNKKYSEKLKDPRWQKKRLIIFRRDNWTCQGCNSKKNTLHVHHRKYSKDKNPWDIENKYLITLCEDCHDLEFSKYWYKVDYVPDFDNCDENGRPREIEFCWHGIFKKLFSLLIQSEKEQLLEIMETLFSLVSEKKTGEIKNISNQDIFHYVNYYLSTDEFKEILLKINDEAYKNGKKKTN